MRSAHTLAAGFLALGFGVVSYGMLRIEPAMGFATPADFFDAEKVLAGYGSTFWLVENFLYLGFALALLVLARASRDARTRRSAVVAAVLFLLLAALDRVGIQLPSLVPSGEGVRIAVAAMLPVRAAVLKATVVSTGVFAWSTTRTHGGPGGPGAWTRAWRALGWVVLALSVLFFFVFVPAPLAFCLWAVGLTVRMARAGSGAPGGP